MKNMNNIVKFFWVLMGFSFYDINAAQIKKQKRSYEQPALGQEIPLFCPSGEHNYPSACGCYEDRYLVGIFFTRYPQARIDSTVPVEALQHMPSAKLSSKREKDTSIIFPVAVSLLQNQPKALSEERGDYIIKEYERYWRAESPTEWDIIRDDLTKKLTSEELKAFNEIVTQEYDELDEGIRRLTALLKGERGAAEVTTVQADSNFLTIPMIEAVEGATTPLLDKLVALYKEAYDLNRTDSTKILEIYDQAYVIGNDFAEALETVIVNDYQNVEDGIKELKQLLGGMDTLFPYENDVTGLNQIAIDYRQQEGTSEIPAAFKNAHKTRFQRIEQVVDALIAQDVPKAFNGLDALQQEAFMNVQQLGVRDPDTIIEILEDIL